ncbi:MAG TPA: phage terminase large subunit [Azospirillum sp.]|nr:phage terminase large subunit [Azospirillum sp.]
MTEENRHVSLRAFVDAWNGLQAQGTPAHHGRIIDWLASCLEVGDRHLLLMAFRGAGKSTLVGLFAAWLLLTDPNRRLLVLAADLRLAKKMVRNVKRIIERHPMTQGMKPKERDQWASEQFTVVRPLELRDPSMLACGIDGNVTGSRADVVICDDVEVPKTSDTAPKRDQLRDALREIDYLLVPGGLQLYVGTPHSYYTIYATEGREEAGETHAFLEGFRRFELPVRDEAGVSAWPERFPEAHIERIRQRSGLSKFESQMLLKPTPATATRLNPEDLRRYDGELECREAQGETVLTLNGVRLVSATAWWDPAVSRPDADGRKGGDDSVVAAVFSDAAGRLYLHRVLYLTVDPADPEHEAKQQCTLVARFLRELHLPGVYVETNGLGTFLPAFLHNELKRARIGASVTGMASTKSKARRIVEAFEARLAAGRIHAHTSVWQTPFVREMREWRPAGRQRGHDDALDAVAGCILAEPLRFDQAPPITPRPDWRPGPVVAPSEWTV